MKPWAKFKTLILTLVIAAQLAPGLSQSCAAKEGAKAKQIGKEAGKPKSKAAPGDKVTEQQALDMVRKRQDVSDWLRLMKESKKKNPQTGQAVVDVESYEGNWRVHVYEQMSDHTATMNWYTVDAKTGKITADF